MISVNSFRKLALNFDNVSEQPHFDKASFRIKQKIFATLDSSKKCATLKLSVLDQSIYCQIHPTFITLVTGAWRRQGWTKIDLKKVPQKKLAEILKKAYLNVAPKEKVKNKTTKTTENFIQTLHPDNSKTNKRILLEKYNTIKEALLHILDSNELTHTELMECLYQNVKDSFEGGVQWYGETVKLDLEARKIIQRTRSRPEKYKLKVSNN